MPCRRARACSTSAVDRARSTPHLAAKGCRVTGVDQFPPADAGGVRDVRALATSVSRSPTSICGSSTTCCCSTSSSTSRPPRRFSTACAAPPGAPTGSRRSSSPPATSCSGSCGCRRCSATSITASAASSTSRTRGSIRSSRSRGCSRSAASTWSGWRASRRHSRRRSALNRTVPCAAPDQRVAHPRVEGPVRLPDLPRRHTEAVGGRTAGPVNRERAREDRGAGLRGTLVPWKRDESHNSRAGHPDWRRCSFLRYAQYPRSSRLASRAPRSGTRATHHDSRD